MFDKLLVIDILQNPAMLAVLFAIVRNIGGYTYNCFEAKKLLPYKAGDFLVTLGLWETFFILLGGMAELPTGTVASITVIVDILRSFKKAVEVIG